MTELVNYHAIKGPDAKDLEILELLRRPGVEQKIQGIAATLANTFSVQTKLLIDIRPGAVFKDTHINQDYIYEGTLAPYDFDALTTVILREARHPVEELKDQGYAIFREKQLQGKRHVCALADFIKMFAMDRWIITDLNIHDERELTKNVIG